MHLLFQQMGEVLSGIRGLHDAMEIRQAQAEQLHELVRSDIATLRRDHRDLEEKFDCMSFVAQHDLEALRCGAAENARSIDVLVASLATLRRPVDQILALKSRLAGILLASSVLGSGVLWVAEPIYRWLVDAALQRR